MNSDAPTFVPEGMTVIHSAIIPETLATVHSNPVPEPPPIVRVNLFNDDPEEAGPSGIGTKEIGVGTTEYFPIRHIICLKPSAATQTVESTHVATRGKVHIIWDNSTVPYNTKRGREVRKLGMNYGSIEATHVCGLTDDDWNQKKNLKETRRAIDDMYRACMDIPLNDGAYTPYEQVITKASEIIDEYLYFQHVCNSCTKNGWQQLILMIISDDRRFVRYLNRRWQVKSITLGLITTDQSILENATLLRTHVIT